MKPLIVLSLLLSASFAHAQYAPIQTNYILPTFQSQQNFGFGGGNPQWGIQRPLPTMYPALPGGGQQFPPYGGQQMPPFMGGQQQMPPMFGGQMPPPYMGGQFAQMQPPMMMGGYNPYMNGMMMPPPPPPWMMQQQPQQSGFGAMLGPMLSSLFSGQGGGLGGLFNGGANSTDPAAAPYCASCERARRAQTVDRIDVNPTPRSTYQPDSYTEASTNSFPPAPRPRNASGEDRIATGDGDDTQPVANTTAPASAPRKTPSSTKKPTTTKPKTDSRGVTIGAPRPLTPAQAIAVKATNKDERKAQTAPVWNTFMANMKVCAPGCTPYDYAAYGERDNHSCHPQGRAMDVHGIQCGNQVYTAQSEMKQSMSSGRFNQFVSCMKGHMKILYRNHAWGPDLYTQTENHWNHAHFSLGCIVHDKGRTFNVE